MPESERKDYKAYADKLIIADASPLINLHILGKMGYLKDLFREVYTTETVKKECRFELPGWMKIEEPQEATKNLLKSKKIDKGERSAIGLAYEMKILKKYDVINKESCLILDDTSAKRKYEKWDLGVENIGLKDVLAFAYDRKFFTKNEGMEMIQKLADNKFKIKKEDIAVIFNEKLQKTRGVKR